MKHSLLFLMLLLCLLPAGVWAQDRRIALVIGNGDYVDLGRLANPPNDATDLAAALKAQGFEVTLLIDATRKVMNQGLNTFYDQLAADPTCAGVFWYAGHGIQAKDENYLIPVGADIQREADLEDEAVSVRKVMGLLDDARNRLNLVVLDACRNNPFPAAGRSGTRGLKVVTSAPPESIIMYSTGAGQVANDGTGRNSPFAQAFLKYLGQPGDIMTTVKAVTAETKRLTGGSQVPYVYSSLTLDFPLALSVAATLPAPAPPPSAAAVVAVGGLVAVPDGRFTMGDWVGSGTEDQTPLHLVQISALFAGTTEVTQAEWKGLMLNNPSKTKGDQLPVDSVSWFDALAYCNKRSLAEGFKPVYQIVGTEVTPDWFADGYRLPTEAEWEYLAKEAVAQQGMAYSGSDDLDAVAWHAPDPTGKSHPVAQKQPNRLGLYDLSGNVAEWCWDWQSPYSSELKTDPVGPETGRLRILRGGSFADSAAEIAVANRGGLDPRTKSPTVGFRVVRSNLDLFALLKRSGLTPVFAIDFRKALVNQTRATVAASLLEVGTEGRFNGKTSKIELTATPPLGLRQATLAVRFRAQVMNKFQTLLTTAGLPEKSLYLGLEFYRLLFSVSPQANPNKLAFPYTFQANLWYDLVLVYDKPEKQMRLFINGELISTTTFIQAPDWPIGTMLIGAWDKSDRSLDGDIDYFYLGEGVLSQEDVSRYYRYPR